MALVMYDDIKPSLIPADAQAVAGYVNGNWPTYNTIVKMFPKAKHLSIAVTSHADAECLDVERGDARNEDAPAWVKRQMLRGIAKPVLYTSASNVNALVKILAASGIMRQHVRIWSAHYNYKRHICGPATCGYPAADATQWTNHSHTESLDESLVSDTFFAVAPKPKPAPKPVPKPVPPPAPKPPAPAPAVQRYLQITDKDGTETFDAYSKAGRFKRGMQFASGLFKGVEVVNKLPTD